MSPVSRNHRPARPPVQRLPRGQRDTWRLEPLEPRVLLSADPVFGALTAILLPAADGDALAAAFDPDQQAPAAIEVGPQPPGDAPAHDDAPIDGAAAIAAAPGSGDTLVLGHPGSSQAIVLQSADGGPIVTERDLVLYADGEGGYIRIGSPLVVQSLFASGSGHTFLLDQDISSAGAQTISDSVRVDGTRSVTTADGNITLGSPASNHYLGGNSASTVDTLTLSAAGRNITFNGAVGNGQDGSDALDALTVSNANDVSFRDSVVVNGPLSITASGIVTFDSSITLGSGGSLTILGATQVVLKGAITLGAGSNLVIEGNEIDLQMPDESISGVGNVTLRPALMSQAMAILSPQGALTSNVLNLETTELAKFADGFSSFTFGHVSGARAVAGSGAVSVGASTVLDSIGFKDSTSIFGGSITVADYSQANAMLRLGAGDSLRLDAVGNISIANEIETDALTLVSTSGGIAQVDASFDGRVGEALRTLTLTAQAATGVSLPNVEVQRLDVLNSGAGDVAVGVNAARSTTRFDNTVISGSVDVLRLAQTAGSGDNDMALTTQNGSITLLAAGSGGSGITLAGSGTLALDARGTGSDLTLGSPISTGAGAVQLSAADALTSSAAGSISASGAAAVSLASGTGALTLGAAVSTAGGSLTLASGAALDLSGVTLAAGASGVITLESVGDLTVGIVEAANAITLRATAGAIVDGLSGDGANLRGEAAAVVLASANGVGAAAAPLRTAVGSVQGSSTAAGGLYIAEETALSVSAGGLLAAGSGSGVGAIVVSVASGALDVQGAVRSDATGSGSGHILLQTQSAGDLSLAANVVSASGSISLLASQALLMGGSAATEVRTRASGQSVDVRAAGAVTLAADASLVTQGGAVRVEAVGSVTIGRIDAGNAGAVAAGAVGVTAGGGIAGAAGAPARNDIVAGPLRLQALGGGIGSGADALGTQAALLAAAATGAIVLAEADALTVGSASGPVVQRVAANGIATAQAADAALAGLSSSATAGANAVVLALASGDLTVAAGSAVATASAGHVLLSAAGRLALGAAVISAGGQVSLLAGADLSHTADADVATSGTGGIDAQAGAALAMADGSSYTTAGGAVRAVAGAALSIGMLDAGSGSVDLAGSRIARAGGGTGSDVIGGALRLQASGSAADDGIGSADQALMLQGSSLAAASAGAGGLFLGEVETLGVATLAVSNGARVLADGSLSTAPPTNAALAGLSSAGALVLQAGAGLTVHADAPISASGHLRLAAGGAGDLALNANLDSSGGAVSLQAGRDLLLAAATTASASGRSLDAVAGRDLHMAASATVSTVDAAVLLTAGGDITLSQVSAGTGSVGLVAGARVIDGDADGDTGVDVQAGALALQAGGAVGSSANALETQVATLAASSAAGGLFVSNSTALTVGAVSVAAQRVGGDGMAASAPVLALQGAGSGTGALVLVALAGDLQVAAGADVRSAGGAIRLDAAAGGLSLAAALDSAFGLASGGVGGAVSLLAGMAVQLADAGDVRTAGGSLDIEAGTLLTMAAGSVADSGGGTLRAAAGGLLTLGRLDAGLGAMSLLASSVHDAAGDDALADLSAASLRLEARGTATGDGVGSSADAIETAVGRLAADVRGGGLFVAQTGDLMLGSVSAVAVGRVQRDGSVAAVPQADAALDNLASPGALVLQATGTLQSGAGGAIIAGGNLLLAATGAAADLLLGADLAVSAGAATLQAGRDVALAGNMTLGGSTRTLDITAGRDLTQAQASSATTSNGAMLLQAGGALTLASLQAGTAGVAVIAGGALIDGDAAGDAAVDITAGALRLSAGAGVGSAANALETSVDSLSLSAGVDGAFLVETSGLRTASTAASVDRVAADGSTSVVTSGAQDDLRSSGALTLTLLAGDLTVDGSSTTPAEAVAAGGVLLLDARAGKLIVNSGVISGGSASLLAGTDLNLAAGGDLTVAGASSIDLQAGGVLTMADGATLLSDSGAVRVVVVNTMTLGAIATGGDVSLSARSLADSGTDDLDIVASGLRVVTTGTGTTQGFGSGALPIQLQVARLAADVAGIGAGGLFVLEADGLRIDTVGPVAVDRVAADGSTARGASTDAALSDVVSGGNVVLRSSTGALSVQQGSADDRGIQAGANVLVDAIAGDVTLDAAVRSSGGHVTVNAGGQLAVNADVATARSARNIELTAAQDVTMAATASLTTLHSDLRVAAGGSVAVSAINTGNGAVGLTAGTGSITEVGSDAEADISAGGLRLNAAIGVGSADNRLETAVISVSARASSGGLWLEEADLVRVTDVTVTVRRVGATGSTAEVVDARQSDLVTTAGNGSIALRTLAGNIDLEDGSAPADGRSVSAHGTGGVSLLAGGVGAVLDATTDTIEQQGAADIESALRLQGTLAITAGLGAGSGDGAITLHGAVDGNAGNPADRLELRSDGGNVRVLGAVGAITPLDSLLIHNAGDVHFAAGLHVMGDVVINATGVVEFLGPLLLDSGSLRIVGATRVVMGNVTVSVGDLQLQTDVLQLTGPLQGSAGGTLRIAGAADAQPVVVGAPVANGAGLRLDAATLAQLQGFGQVNIGRSDGGALAVDSATLASLNTGALQLAGSRIDLVGSATTTLGMTDRIVAQSPGAMVVSGRVALAAAGADLSLDSGDTLTMAADAVVLAPGGDITLRAVHDMAVGLLDARNGTAAAGAVLLVSSQGTLLDAGNDEAVNLQAASVTLRGQGPVLVDGQSTTPAALDVESPQLDVDYRSGIVLRDTGTDGRTRFNLAVGDVLMQAAVVTGAPSRGAPTPLPDSGAATGTTDAADALQVASWLAALRPLADLRGVALSAGALMLDGPAGTTMAGTSLQGEADSAAVRYLSAMGAASLQSAGGMAAAVVQRHHFWDDSLVL